MDNKYGINLLQAELLPKRALLTLHRVVVSWTLVIAVMLLVAFYSQYQVDQLAEQLRALSKVKVKQDKVLADLKSNIQQNKVDATLQNKLETLMFVMSNKAALYEQLTNQNTTYVAGFAKAMTDLSDMHSENISLRQVTIENNQIYLTGAARTPDAVPAWLALFDSSSVLSGKVFSTFDMTQNDNGLIDFTVKTQSEMDMWEEGY
jgi:Tfp pilus assembly protein PilN